MTTILISILSGVLGLVTGFTIGIYKCAKCAAANRRIADNIGELFDYVMYIETQHNI